jgi:hypothetical protein
MLLSHFLFFLTTVLWNAGHLLDLVPQDPSTTSEYGNK